MNRQDIETVVLTVLAVVLKCEVNRDTSRKNAPQWDSLKHIEVIFSIEDELGVLFPENALTGLESVASIVESVIGLRDAA